MYSEKQKTVEEILYRIGILVFVMGLVIGCVARQSGISLTTILGEWFGECLFYRITHWYCPGCGGTRAVREFLHGRWISSVRYNGFVFYMMAGYMVFMLSHTVRWISKGRVPGIKFRLLYLYIGVAIGILHWCIKNAGVR